MIEKEIEIKNRLGLHARPAALFVQTANKYQSMVKVSKDGEDEEVNGKSIMGLMMLAAEQGSKILIKADGFDEQLVIGDLEKLISNNFGED